MAQKTLNAYVVLSGRVDNTFGQIGTALINMGSTIDQISHKLIDFGKESIEVYQSYEYSMRDAQVALSTTYGRNTKALNEVMHQLDAQATQWAATTIFHTDDVANAIAKAAHAGWDLDKIMSGIPEAMKLAQAGGLDLSQGLDYIIKTTNAAGIGFDELEGWVDLWAYTANRSAGDIESFGEAMTRMGSTMKFAGSREELLAMLAVLHDAGTVGSDAGTLLRNTMIRLVAPTKKATDAMAELGITQADIDEAFGEVDGDTAAAVKRLEELGFSAYDSQGNLKDFTDIFRDLSVALSGMSDEERNDILSSIFPTRTITGALALLGEVDGAWLDLLKDLYGGAAEGYGDYAAETMMSGLTGSIETFLSKVERLKQVTGAELAPQTETILGNIGKLVDYFASGGVNNGVSAGLDFAERVSGWIGSLADNLGRMDPVAFDGIVSALGSLATLGPGLLLAGGGIRFASYALGTHIGRLALAAALLVTCAEAFTKMAESDFEGKFGEMELDAEPLREQLSELSQAFNEAHEPVNQYSTALAQATSDYEEAAKTFSSQLITDSLAHTQVTPEVLKSYQDMGENLMNAALTGVKAAGDLSKTSAMALFQADGEEEADVIANPIFQAILDATNAEYAEAEAQLKALGEGLAGALTEAFETGEVTPELERQIRDYVRDINRIVAEAQRDAEDSQRRAALMAKAQSLSYDSAAGFINDEVIPQRDEQEQALRAEYWAARLPLDREYERALNAAETDAERAGVESHYQELFSGLDAQLEEGLTALHENYADMIDSIMDVLLRDSEYGDEMSALEAVWSEVAGGASLDEALDSVSALAAEGWGAVFNSSPGEHMLRFYDEWVEALGGEARMRAMAETARGRGENSLADRYERILGIRHLLGMATTEADLKTLNADWYQSGVGMLARALGLDPLSRENLFGVQSGSAEAPAHVIVDELPTEPEQAAQSASLVPSILAYVNDLLDGAPGVSPDVYGAVPWERIGSNMQGTPEYAELVNSLAAMGEGMNTLAAGLEPHRGEAIPELVLSAISDARAQSGTYALEGAGEAAAQAHTEAQGALDSLGDVNEQVAIPNAATAAQIARQAMEAQFRTPITQYVQVQQSGSGIGGSGLGTARIAMKARGGRETQPSIFAEAGIPEWYIPEEHTANTARLILGAAYGSGFDLFELAAMAGARLFAEGGTSGTGTIPGLAWGALASGGGSSGGVQVEYAPVIHADSAEGVGRVLEEDKKRLRKMMNEWWKDKERMVSLTAY